MHVVQTTSVTSSPATSVQLLDKVEMVCVRNQARPPISGCVVPMFSWGVEDVT